MRTRKNRPLRHPDERGESLFGLLVTHPPLPVTSNLPVLVRSAVVVAAGPGTTRRLGLAALAAALWACLRGAWLVAAIAVDLLVTRVAVDVLAVIAVGVLVAGVAVGLLVTGVAVDLLALGSASTCLPPGRH